MARSTERSVDKNTLKENDDKHQSVTNPTVVDNGRMGKLPMNVGFVAGSEPGHIRESGEEEENNGRTDSARLLEYEDIVGKTVESTSTYNLAKVDNVTTTEPPLQLVQDLIDALAGGGLNAILGPPKKLSESANGVHKKLGDLEKILRKPMKQKQDCASGRMKFLVEELTDLTVKFNYDAAVYSLQHCARVCYETGCTSAAFTRYPRTVCLMRYNNDTQCDYNTTETLTSWRFTGIQQVVKLECIQCDEEVDIHEKKQTDITNLGAFSTDEVNSVIVTNEGVTAKCDGRLEFQILPIGSLPRLNITNDVPARTPADCAKKCFETKDCSMAGFISNPTSTISNGVCLLTSDTNVCGNNADYIPQYAAINPFLISCFRCSACTYHIRTVTPDRELPSFSHTESVSSIGDCAQACYAQRCTMAQYDSSQHLCSMTSEPLNSKCMSETAVVTEGVLPVTLECVTCSS
ncbi:PAN domain protein [Dictyocaulus viviparus]|uniref:PAN domain protein n=1 Tax=Dictyocaulus viviparus TaxID=29172 RepID=A0A0D8XQ45_DICVI|nr:PAN domain protein [Dictyocaulus viviparus]